MLNSFWWKADAWKQKVKAYYEHNPSAEKDAAKALLNGTYTHAIEYLEFKPKKGITYPLPEHLFVINVELGEYDGPLPDHTDCINFKAGKAFNRPLPKNFSCVNFFCGDKFNQKLPKNFHVKKFSCDGSFNQSLPDDFRCDIFMAGNKFNQPLPENIGCHSFFCQQEFNQPLPSSMKVMYHFHCGWKFNQPLPTFFSAEKFDAGTSFAQRLGSDFNCNKLVSNTNIDEYLDSRLISKINEHVRMIPETKICVVKGQPMVPEPKNVYCIYHCVDNDGFSSGALVKAEWPETHLIPFIYDYEFEYLKKIPDGASVFIVDASLPINQMKALMKRCDVHWIDHHEVPIAEANQDPVVSRCKGLRTIDEEAACELVFKYLHPDKEIPPAIALMGRYDMWDQKFFPKAHIFDIWLRAQNSRLSDSTMPFWIDVFKMTISEIDQKIEMYKPVYDNIRINDKISAKSICYEGTVCGYKAIVANRSQIGSGYFESVLKPEHDLMVSWHMKPNGKYKYTIYSNNFNVDVGQICKKFGGGGRKGVGGFMHNIPFLPNIELLGMIDLGYINKNDPNVTIKSL